MADPEPGPRHAPDVSDPATWDAGTALATEVLGVAQQRRIDLVEELRLRNSEYAGDEPAA